MVEHQHAVPESDPYHHFVAAGFHHPETGNIVFRTLVYSGVPALAMAVGSVSVCFVTPPRKVQATAQRFSSGLLMGVTIIDVFPLLRSRLYPYGKLDPWNTFALYAGFSSAVLLMYLLDNMQCGGGSRHEDDVSDRRAPAEPPGDFTDSDLLSESAPSLPSIAGSVHTEGPNPSLRFRRWNTGQLPVELLSPTKTASSLESTVHIPWGLIIAVVLDCTVDGMLIGLTTSAESSSGLTLALAASIESAFLGFSFTVSVMRATRRRWAAVIGALPCLAMVAAAVTAGLSSRVIESTSAFSGMLAFALIALLFMIVEDLLVEARETEFGDLWTIGVWFYVGLLVSITFDIVL